ncbi:uroporphyrinogen-III synthase [Candidatus Pandoraea novymonadis]|uniref:Uroporphyrinogen-III synthase n=1 Tax=Candidatus Pandoraea novymonadis TaxID=1808959 RepID=A0ABX5FG61_9BURK|nr:uroporphyrinogen-III synthase [Candidatus Pandoraea novymonadis]PSB91997.1 Uroporphyrinogen-III synthase [Candidatus Pandoraea novymonadis]
MTLNYDNHNPCVILTRPVEQSAWLSDALQGYGINVLTFPLLDIVPHTEKGLLTLLDNTFSDLSGYALVIFVSPNAVIYALRRFRYPWPEHVAIAVVGPGSAAALANAGIAPPRYRVIMPPNGPQARFDSEALLVQLNLSSLAGRRVLLVRGDGGRELLSNTLRENGVQLDIVSVYKRQTPLIDDACWEKMEDMVMRSMPCAWVLTSSEAIKHLVALISSRCSVIMRARIYKSLCFTSHARIADIARDAGFNRIKQYSVGDEKLFKALKSWAESIQIK